MLSITPTNKISFDTEAVETHRGPVSEILFNLCGKKISKMEVDLEKGQVRMVNIKV